MSNGRREHIGIGVTDAAYIAVGGENPSGNYDGVEAWNGSSWAEVNELNTDRRRLNGGAAYQAGIVYGGYSTTIANNTEEWNGASWTNAANLNAGRDSIGGATQVYTASLAFGGQAPSITNNTESYNGTSWTEVNEMNTARYGLTGTGTSTSALAFGSATNSPDSLTEFWNGSSWTEVADLATGRGSGIAKAGISNAAFAAGGYTGTARSAATEEFSADDFTIKTVTTS